MVYYFGGIDYKETFRTKYHDENQKQIIETSHFRILTPNNWIHIFNGYDEEGGAGGCFLTKHGLLHYEYTFFSNPFEFDSIFVFETDSMTLNRFKIFVGKNESDEYGIHIPKQREMELPFSFYISKPCRENYEELKEGIENMEFKKYFNLELIEK